MNAPVGFVPRPGNPSSILAAGALNFYPGIFTTFVRLKDPEETDSATGMVQMQVEFN